MSIIKHKTTLVYLRRTGNQSQFTSIKYPVLPFYSVTVVLSVIFFYIVLK